MEYLFMYIFAGMAFWGVGLYANSVAVRAIIKKHNISPIAALHAIAVGVVFWPIAVLCFLASERDGEDDE